MESTAPVWHSTKSPHRPTRAWRHVRPCPHLCRDGGQASPINGDVHGGWLHGVHVAVWTGLHFSPLTSPSTFPSSTTVRPCSRCPPSGPSTLSACPHVLPSDIPNPLTRSRPSSTCCLFLLDTNPIPYIKICRTLDSPVQIALIRAVWPFTALLQDSRQDCTASPARATTGVFVALVGIVV